MDPGCCSLKKIVIPVEGDVKPGHIFYGGKQFSDLHLGKVTVTLAAIESFLAIVPAELAKGNIVELGDFGSFWLRATSDGVDTAEEVRADQIGTVLPHFNPGKEFKRVLDAIKFNKN